MSDFIKDLLNKDKISDIGARIDALNKSLQFPGPTRLNEHLYGYVSELIERFKSMSLEDATLEVEGTFWRGHLDKGVVDGQWIRFRRMPQAAPSLRSLPSDLPKWVEAALTSPDLSSGGLVLIAGGPGCGKTFTASATVKSRLEAFGGMAYTIEEPPEHPLNGWHGDGYCAQTWVKDEGEFPWARAMKGVLRSQPAGTPTIMFLGEVREDEAARIAVQASGNGFLVICTSFGTNVPTGIATFANRLGQENQDIFSKQFRLVIYQKLVDGMLDCQMLKSTTAVEQMIMKGQWSAIEGELSLQRNLLRQAQSQGR